MSFKTVKLLDISKPKQWKNLPSSELTQEGYFVYGANGIIGKYTEYNHEFPTLVITCRGATCGSLHITKPKSYINSNAMALDNLSDDVNIKYLYYSLFNRGFKDVITGSAQPQITREGLSKIKIPLPPLQDQIRIAEILTQAENLITQRKESILLLDELLKSTFLEMFGDKLEETSQLEHLGDNISYLTSGSRGWAKHYSDSGAKFLRIQNIGGGIIRTDNLIFVNPPNSAETGRTRVKEGDLIISITADLGRTSVVPKNFGEAYINQHLALIRLNENINPIYAAYFYNMPFGNNAIQKKNRSAVKAGLNFNDIRSFPIIIPKMIRQNQFALIVEKIETLKTDYQASLKELENMYGVLSQKAFKYELQIDIKKSDKITKELNSEDFNIEKYII
ncbi:restriction endonuclease subunit S, partial [Flavobacterium sp. PL002]|uniref:restriction endonuclease subunit S n=1 Tax=Flavobacterium sp. PL002 TaxID=1897058 RepID=UPI0017883989